MNKFFTLGFFLLLASYLEAEVVREEGYLQITAESSNEASWESGSQTRPVKISSGDVAIGWKKRRVSVELVNSEGSLRAERIFPAEPEELRQMVEITEALNRDIMERSRAVTRGAKDLMPPMALWNQAGEFRLKKNFLGHPLAINFIFTRCANARMCPASTQAMQRLAEELDKDPQLANVKLLTISFDPTYDSPGVLRTYADSRKIPLARHEFLTGNLAQINHLMRQYGIITTREDGTIVHNAALILVSAEGRILQRREGAVFDAVAVARYFKTLNELSAQP